MGLLHSRRFGAKPKGFAHCFAPIESAFPTSASVSVHVSRLARALDTRYPSDGSKGRVGSQTSGFSYLLYGKVVESGGVEDCGSRPEMFSGSELWIDSPDLDSNRVQFEINPGRS